MELISDERETGKNKRMKKNEKAKDSKKKKKAKEKGQKFKTNSYPYYLKGYRKMYAAVMP